MGGRASGILSFGVKGGLEGGARFQDALKTLARAQGIVDSFSAPAPLLLVRILDGRVRSHHALGHQQQTRELSQRLLALYEERPDFVQPRVRYNEALSFIRGGLQDVSLTRRAVDWGVPVPWDPQQVFYVWWDALLNYYTALSFARPGHDLTDTFWPATYHLIGKDILKFHTIFWPAMLMAAGLPLPEHVFVHGFLLMDGEKMSKSLGNLVFVSELRKAWDPRAIRLVAAAGVGAAGMALYKMIV